MGGSNAGTNPFTGAFDAFAEETLKGYKVPGISIAVVDDDQIYAKGYGIATLPDTPATADTIYYTASTTKAFTAGLLAHFISSKRFPSVFPKGWKTPISHIIRDDFVLEDDWATNHITLEDATSHRTGMPRHDKSSFHKIDGREATPKDIVRNLRNLSLAIEPRTKFAYCNFMYVTLSYVIEAATGRYLGDVFKEEIWDPLEMKSTYFNVQGAQEAPEHFAAGYYWDEKEHEFREVAPMPTSEVSGAGGIMSTVNDYARWLKCLIHEERPFSRETHADIRTPRIINGSPDGHGSDVGMYGLGWDRVSFRGHPLYTHAGGMHAYGSQVYWLPDEKYGVVLLGNTASTSNAAEDILAWKLIQDRLGIPTADQFNPKEKWDQGIEKMKHTWDNAINNLFPVRPKKPVPASTSPSNLVGTYYDKGYGVLHVKEIQQSEGSILVADPVDSTWRYRLKLDHVSGDYYVGYMYIPGNDAPVFREAFRVEFKVDVRGRPLSLNLDLRLPGEAVHEGIRSFERI